MGQKDTRFFPSSKLEPKTRYTFLVNTGKVVNRAGLELPRTCYDTAIVGGGLLGLACAFYLRRFAPERTLLIIEADGVPSEEGRDVCFTRGRAPGF